MNPADDPPSDRDLFPYPEDRAVIQAFLEGRKIFIHKNSTVQTHGGALTMEKIKIAWFDETTGALVAALPADFNTQPARRVLDYIGKLMGDGRQITRERPNISTPLSWFHGDQPIYVGGTFTIAGPLSVLAYRAQVGALTKPTSP